MNLPCLAGNEDGSAAVAALTSQKLNLEPVWLLEGSGNAAATARKGTGGTYSAKFTPAHLLLLQEYEIKPQQNRHPFPHPASVSCPTSHIHIYLCKLSNVVNSKGRLVLPAKIKDDLGKEFIVTKGLDGC